MNKPLPPPLRLVHLSSYLRELIADAAKQGKIAKIVGNPVEVAAVALMSGTIAVAEMMWTDVRLLAGDAGKRIQIGARPVLEGLAARGAGALIDKIFGGAKR